MRDTAPYDDIVYDLLASIMRAQADIATRLSSTALGDIPDGLINRHFEWLTLHYPEGENRHLFDSFGGTFPLRTQALRARSQLPRAMRATLRARHALPWESDEDDLEAHAESEAFVQAEPTRISRLIKQSFVSVLDRERARYETTFDEDGQLVYLTGSNDSQVEIKSPLSVLREYLTIPGVPGSEAYALLPLRNVIFQLFQIYPDGVGPSSKASSFTVSDIEAALSHIWTSLRVRHYSKGQDTLPPEGRSEEGGMLRHFLAAMEVLWVRFANLDECRDYLSHAALRPERAEFAFVRSKHLERLPELGEVVNQLWGLPIPIRGADTLFRGGLKFSGRQGLVVGVHGGPGAGKTSLALALGATLAPFGINTLFITAEETTEDLEAKIESLVSDDLRRLSFFPKHPTEWIQFQNLSFGWSEPKEEDSLKTLESALLRLSQALGEGLSETDEPGASKPCRAIVVLDGIHDLVMTSHHSEGKNGGSLRQRLREFIFACRELRALVILTAGEDWAGDRALDYLVDVAIRLSHESVREPGRKPDRRITISKARHQLCAIGTHGIQLAGAKGVRFSPQINYQLDRKAIWKTRLAEMGVYKRVLELALSQKAFENFSHSSSKRIGRGRLDFQPSQLGVRLFRGSNIFLNGQGAGGKAALALKMAISPTVDQDEVHIQVPEKVLVVSFLYPQQYYINIREALLRLRRYEYGIGMRELRPTVNVMHLYPGNYRPDQLFNRIDWELESADLAGDPYTTIVIDGLHNVARQFPEIQEYPLFWPQIYTALRARPITIISTHTTFLSDHDSMTLNDRRIDPIMHLLIQNTDFRFEIDPLTSNWPPRPREKITSDDSNIFWLRTVAAINQPIPLPGLLWSRDRLLLFESGQARLPF
ncbi:ATPase domain-containing protein [Sphingomonas psychrotolerans]|uniref:AAA+ ATPase domain-containing protein n=1 Tax=Sphingomonas psychrotolerans TaxID=1327635 RepID=A0A2K8MHS7_9SPHN|nr:ATPase domain-containing protein [Sphingomonas psychrotolerans]ATY32544.1 hypothetical protein CVN68_11635 [Sphingomonas psychrotolerans]